MNTSNQVEKAINNWPWASFLAPLWAVASLIKFSAMMIVPDMYINIEANVVMFNLAPWWVWAPVCVCVNALLLVRPKNLVWQILQGALVLMEGAAIFFASLGNDAVTPTAGVTLLAVAIALWLGMVRSLKQIPTPYHYAKSDDAE